MDIPTLQSQYRRARETDDFDVHHAFIQALLESNDPTVLRYHYELLRDRDNRDLYLRVRAAFAKQGAPAADFLVEQSTTERDLSMRADILHLLGILGHPGARLMARDELRSPDTEMRHRACYVLGWLGQTEDVPRLGAALREDPDPRVRRTAATAHSQLFEHAPRQRVPLLRNLQAALRTEADPQVAGWIVYSVQEILGKRFGLKWDREEDELRGEIEPARAKATKALEKVLAS